jgi:hypothetical protein
VIERPSCGVGERCRQRLGRQAHVAADEHEGDLGEGDEGGTDPERDVAVNIVGIEPRMS